MPKINILPKHIAELIAAGEVVERPASVVKELVENSFDAGAKNVTVEIKDGGVTYIRVTDDGCGILREDVPNAFVSHATSKVFTADDLACIGTLGFRGEALASVAAVARVEMLTRCADGNVGTRYVISGGEELENSDAGCPVGTTLIVRDIFYNTPARMKFLKKDVGEGNAVASAMRCAALSHPEISVRLIRDGKEAFFTPGDGKALSAVHSVFGREFSETFIPASAVFEGIACDGFVSRPEFSRQNRNMQFFFLNGRYVRTPTGSAALSEGYKGSIMAGKFPACVLYLTMPADRVDVNVHPAKTEVRFDNERPIFSSVLFSVKNALSGDVRRPHIGFTSAAASRLETAAYSKMLADTPLPPRTPPERAAAKPSENFWQRASASPTPTDGTPVRTVPAFAPVRGELHDTLPDMPAGRVPEPLISDPPSVIPSGKEVAGSMEATEIPDDIHVSDDSPAVESVAALPDTVSATPAQAVATAVSSRRIVGEAFGTYIIVEEGDTLLYIDKHAAHERMLYNKLAARGTSPAAQLMLIPVSIALPHEEYSAAVENLGLLSDAGFVVEDFGSGSIIVRACPPELGTDDVSAAVQELCAFLSRSGRLTTPEKLENIRHTVACRAAIKAGDFTTPAEMEIFVDRLLADPEIRHCPHGRPVAVEMTRAEMEKSFGRI